MKSTTVRKHGRAKWLGSRGSKLATVTHIRPGAVSRPCRSSFTHLAGAAAIQRETWRETRVLCPLSLALANKQTAARTRDSCSECRCCRQLMVAHSRRSREERRAYCMHQNARKACPWKNVTENNLNPTARWKPNHESTMFKQENTVSVPNPTTAQKKLRAKHKRNRWLADNFTDTEENNCNDKSKN